LDDKTFKMTLSLTIGLTIVNYTFALLIGNIDNNLLKLFFILLISISVTYILLGGFIAFTSLTTQKTYGYGTNFLLQCKEGNRTQCCEDLHLQEESNLIRHIKNESSYQCLRNGFFLLFIIFMVYFFDLVIELVRDMQKA
jgi:ABC-type amino acid transport system permease subunit